MVRDTGPQGQIETVRDALDHSLERDGSIEMALVYDHLYRGLPREEVSTEDFLRTVLDCSTGLVLVLYGAEQDYYIRGVHHDCWDWMTMEFGRELYYDGWRSWDFTFERLMDRDVDVVLHRYSPFRGVL